MNLPSILICTVGTGNIDQLRLTLLEPLKKSIRKGEWTRVILVPSQLTKENATRLSEEVQDLPVEIKELPECGAEDNADACFGHFDQILSSLHADGISASDLLVDFTRGTKAMSAALVLAAVRHELPQLRYVSGGKRDERGTVVPGTEIVAEVRTTIATARRRLDDAYGFFRRGNFAAVLDGLPNPRQLRDGQWPRDLSELVSAVRTLATFYSAWDRLDYCEAQNVGLSAYVDVPSPWDKFLPLPAIRDWVSLLAQPWPETNPERATRLRSLVADLLANGERRLRDHQFEDAVIRGYRVLELIGQIRLFDRDIDSAAIPTDRPYVKEFQEKLLKKKSHPLSETDGKYQASREQSARLLKHLGDPIADDLMQLGNYEEGQVKLSRRNYSVWIHGFEAIAGSDPDPIHNLLKELEKLLVKDGGAEAESRLQQARSMDLSRRTQ